MPHGGLIAEGILYRDYDAAGHDRAVLKVKLEALRVHIPAVFVAQRIGGDTPVSGTCAETRRGIRWPYGSAAEVVGAAVPVGGIEDRVSEHQRLRPGERAEVA